MHGKKSDPILEHYKSSGTYKTTNISIHISTILFSLTQIKIYIYITHTHSPTLLYSIMFESFWEKKRFLS